MLTGTLSGMTREQAADKVRACGGKVTDAVSRNTSLLVVGAEPSTNKVEKAKTLGVRMLPEPEFLALLGSAGGPAPTPAKDATAGLPLFRP